MVIYICSMMTIVFATGNEHKISEVSTILSLPNIRLESLKKIGWNTEIIEDGLSFKENAYIKAHTIFQSNHPRVLAEDSGLMVDYLGGAPGIYSARFAGDHKSDEDNNLKLLKKLQSASNRKAKFTATICYIDHSGVYYFEGICPGEITTKHSGVNGFGYDPIFIPDGYDKTFAELGNNIKSKISHRAKAFNKFSDFLKSKNPT